MQKITLLLVGFLFISCNEYKKNEELDSQKKAIEQQEQRIKNLEDRLDNMEKSNTQSGKMRHASLPDNTINKRTFYIGSSEADVIEIQSTPTSIMSAGDLKMYSYDSSTVTFEGGKVKSYSNYGSNLKLKPN